MLNLENLTLLTGKENKLGEGSFGLVTKGLYCETPVAVKKLLSKKIKDQQELQKEIEHLRVLTHPNIVSMLAHNEKFIVMELFDGNAEYKKENGMTYKELAILGRDCMRAISYMNSHLECIVHADIKPENILVSRDGNGRIYKAVLGDVGLSVACHDYNGFIGTPGYMPDNLEDDLLEDDPVSNLDDVYALAVSMLDSYFEGSVHTSYSSEDERESLDDNTYEYASKLSMKFRPIVGRMFAARSGYIQSEKSRCEEQTDPVYNDVNRRKGPPYKATDCVGIVRRGNDKKKWMSKLTANKSAKWVPFDNSYRTLADDLVTKFILKTTRDFNILVGELEKTVQQVSSPRKRQRMDMDSF